MNAITAMGLSSHKIYRFELDNGKTVEGFVKEKRVDLDEGCKLIIYNYIDRKVYTIFPEQVCHCRSLKNFFKSQ